MSPLTEVRTSAPQGAVGSGPRSRAFLRSSQGGRVLLIGVLCTALPALAQERVVLVPSAASARGVAESPASTSVGVRESPAPVEGQRSNEEAKGAGEEEVVVFQSPEGENSLGNAQNRSANPGSDPIVELRLRVPSRVVSAVLAAAHGRAVPEVTQEDIAALRAEMDQLRRQLRTATANQRKQQEGVDNTLKEHSELINTNIANMSYVIEILKRNTPPEESSKAEPSQQKTAPEEAVPTPRS